MIDFGLQIEPQFGFTYDQVAELAESCAGLGYKSVWASDHFMLNTRDVDRNCLDCWTLLAALAADVKGIRLGSLVTSVSHRNPAVLAKMAASIDMISGGRLEFGIGAGWNDVEHRAYGISFPGPGRRVDRFLEGMEIITRLWRDAKATYQGKHYSIEDAICAPKPVQKPAPPILIGGSQPRMLRAMARFAQAVNLGSRQSPESYAQTLAQLEAICREEKTDFAAIRKTHLMTFTIARDDDELEEVVKRVSAREGTTAQGYRDNRGFSFIGTADEAVDTVKRYADAGVTEIMTRFPFGEDARSMRLFADRVMPRV